MPLSVSIAWSVPAWVWPCPLIVCGSCLQSSGQPWFLLACFQRSWGRQHQSSTSTRPAPAAPPTHQAASTSDSVRGRVSVRACGCNLHPVHVWRAAPASINGNHRLPGPSSPVAHPSCPRAALLHDAPSPFCYYSTFNFPSIASPRPWTTAFLPSPSCCSQSVFCVLQCAAAALLLLAVALASDST